MSLVRRYVFVAAALVLLAAAAPAEVKLPAIFSDHMILQRDQPIPVWGWAAPGERVRVESGAHNAEVVADAEGHWKLALPAQPAGGPHEFTISGANKLTLRDVWVGEVWLCSGQSNMAMTVSRAQNFEVEQAAAKHPRIREFKTAAAYSADPQADCRGQWTVCSPESVGQYSATAYFFARELERTLDVPVGIINSSVGGTPIDSWISEPAQRDSAELRPLFAQVEAQRKTFNAEQARARYEQQLAKWKDDVKAARAAGKTLPRAPRDPVALHEKKADCGGLYNGMIAPVIGYGFRGALWYQGEANSMPEKAAFYRHQLPLLVTDWRAHHGGGDFPFAWAQLPNFRGAGRNWPLVREAMLTATSLPHTGVAVTIDVGETADIHPRNKQAVGQRLAFWALGDVYGRKSPRLPRPTTGITLERGGLEVQFEPADVSLAVTPTEPSLSIAAIAGADKVWKPARVEVAPGNRVRFTSPEVTEPVAVRYLWSNDPAEAPLRTAAGLPVSPFRTDAWDDVTPFDEIPDQRGRATAAAQ